MVTEVAGRLSGAGPGGMDSVSPQQWFLRFGAASGELRLIVADFTEWLRNGRPPWDAYQDMMTIRLIALVKQAGVITVRVGEIWIRIMAK